MTEDFLHYAWQFRKFKSPELKLAGGGKVVIHKTGIHNTNAGPDFLNAKVEIDGTLWAGNVEIHIASSDWMRHGHSSDPAYNNVILHVVYHHDKDITDKSGNIIPTVELTNQLDARTYHTYKAFLGSSSWIPCAHQISDVPDIVMHQWVDRLLVERLEQKTEQIRHILQETNNSWEETFYRHLARNFGMKVNSFGFEVLSRSLPQAILAKHKNNLLQIEALLFGQAGLLEDVFHDDYPRALQKEYAFLRKKYDLRPLQKQVWNFLRLRPANFPTVRISQLAALIYGSSHLFSKILAAEKPREIQRLFDVQASAYWETHYNFDTPSAKRKKKFGTSATANVLINTVVPFLFLYGRERKELQHEDRALSLLEHLAPEKNSIVTRWQKTGVKATTAYNTQALLQLYNNYCKEKRCLKCAAGNSLLKA